MSYLNIDSIQRWKIQDTLQCVGSGQGGTSRGPVGEGAFLSGLGFAPPPDLPLYRPPMLVLANATEQHPTAGEAVDVDQTVSVAGAGHHPPRRPLAHLREQMV